MSKRRKGVSLEEKRSRLLNIYHESKEVYNLKELETLGSKAGIVLQTIKDVNQSLIDDNLVDSDKIGSGNYFWSFPSKITQQRKRKRNELQQRYDEMQVKLKSINEEIEKDKAERCLSDERKEKLTRLMEIKTSVDKLEVQLQYAKENDPAILIQLETQVAKAKDGANRWTDNIFNIKSWVTKKKGYPAKDVDKWLGIKDDFDYVE